MAKTLKLRLLFPFLHSLAVFLRLSAGAVGTAAYYGPPYLPTVCYGRNQDEFPPNSLFAAAGEGIWDNGASCGRQYQVKCLSSAAARNACTDQIIQVKVVDRGTMLPSQPSRNGTTLVLSANAFQMIASQAAGVINIEFAQV